MKKYEYKVSKVLKHEEVETYMNKMAKEGWRVVDTVFWEKFNIGIVVTLEKEIIE